jgi:hypothetical protein
MRSADVYPDAGYLDTDFVALDSDEIIGRVCPIEHGTEKGLWFWTMMATCPGPSFNERSGTEARRGDAGRRVAEAYDGMLRRTRGGPRLPLFRSLLEAAAPTICRIVTCSWKLVEEEARLGPCSGTSLETDSQAAIAACTSASSPNARAAFVETIFLICSSV